MKVASVQRQVLTIGRFEIPCAVHSHGCEYLVCVNGMQQAMASWRTVARRVGASGRYRVVLFDFPHQGRALTSGDSQPLTLAEQVDVLAGVVDALAPQQPVALIGGSWGALIAAMYAALFPARVSRLVLGSFQPRANSRLRDVARRGQWLVEQDRLDDLAALFISEFGSGMTVDRQRALREQFRGLRPQQVRQMYCQGSALAAAASLADLVDLRAIRAETLVVNGADDPIVDAGDPALGQIPAVEVVVVAGAGHFLHLERPETVEIYNQFFHRPPREAERGRAYDPSRNSSISPAISSGYPVCV